MQVVFTIKLTGDQERAVTEISQDMQDERPMQRLLQGDVGSGKTVVATLSLVKAVENGYQSSYHGTYRNLSDSTF